MEQTSPERQARIVDFSHGGGPLPILGEPGHKADDYIFGKRSVAFQW